MDAIGAVRSGAVAVAKHWIRKDHRLSKFPGGARTCPCWRCSIDLWDVFLRGANRQILWFRHRGVGRRWHNEFRTTLETCD